MVHKIESKADFTAKLSAAGDKLVVIDFYATWCGPCKVIGPVFEKMATEMKDTMVALKVDVDEVEDLVSEYKIEVMPSFVFIKKGEKLETLRGGNENNLRNAIKKHI